MLPRHSPVKGRIEEEHLRTLDHMQGLVKDTENMRQRYRDKFQSASPVADYTNGQRERDAVQHRGGLITEAAPSCHEYHKEERKVIEVLRKEKSHLERDVYEFKLSNNLLRRELDDLKVARNLEAEHREKKAKEHFEERLLVAQQKHNAKVAEMGEAMEKLTTARDWNAAKLAELMSEMGSSSVASFDLKRQITELTKELESAKTDNKSRMEIVRGLERDKISLTSTINGLREEVSRLTNSLSQKDDQGCDELQRLREEREEWAHARDSLERKIELLQDELKACERKRQSLENARKASSMANETNVSLIETLQSRLNRTNDEMMSLQSLLHDLTIDNTNLKDCIKKLKMQLNQGTLAAPPRDDKDSKSRFTQYVDLKREISSLQGVIETMKAREGSPPRKVM